MRRDSAAKVGGSGRRRGASPVERLPARPRDRETRAPCCAREGPQTLADTHVPQRASGDPLRYLLRQPWHTQRAHAASQMGTSTGAPRLAAGGGRGGRGSRTRGLEPPCGHGVRAIPVTSCLPCPALFGRRGGTAEGWPRSARQRRRVRALGRVARKPEGRSRWQPLGNPCQRKRRRHA